MGDLDHQEAGEIRRDPLLVEGVVFLLLDAVVAGQMEAFGIVGLEVGIGRRGAKAVNVIGKWPWFTMIG